ncbi:stage IV sporulation protein FB [Cerasibacillus terrae]|uniref:Stage IV sporulation protein FB n=1 Tax=Cerasibacillus terrae TaxID=2498845 RepID=A0A5C8P3P7_9BACI|nr:stage IV sporulation protein FB [Cerasibacillus terrae]
MNRKYVPPIYIHPILFIFIGISFVTGTFLSLFIILMIVFIHELGHYLMASFFNWRIKKVTLWVFGGVMETDEHASRPLYEEILVTIAGPVQHLFIYLFYFMFKQFEVFPDSILAMILLYNTMILVFNLLPVWPLDGGKFLFFCLSHFLPYRKAYDGTILFSIIVCILSLVFFLLFNFNPFTLCLLIGFLMIENIVEWKRRYFVFLRFLLNRYHVDLDRVRKIKPIVVSSEEKLISVLQLFQRDTKHFIYIIFPGQKRERLDESKCLQSYFYEKQIHKTIGELVKNT